MSLRPDGGAHRRGSNAGDASLPLFRFSNENFENNPPEVHRLSGVTRERVSYEVENSDGNVISSELDFDIGDLSMEIPLGINLNYMEDDVTFTLRLTGANLFDPWQAKAVFRPETPPWIDREGTRRATTTETSARVMSVDVLPGKESFVTGHSDGSVLQWDLAKADEPIRLSSAHLPGSTICAREGGVAFICAWEGGVAWVEDTDHVVWRTPSGDIHKFETLHSAVKCLCVCNGKLLSGTDNGAVSVHGWDDGRNTSESLLLAEENYPVASLCALPHGKVAILWAQGEGNDDMNGKVLCLNLLVQCEVILPYITYV